MQARIVLVAAGIGFVATAFVIQACGDTEVVATPSDSGADVALDTGKKDTAPPDEDADTCDPSADFTKEIPDAAIADGASTSGLCLQCAHAKCKAQIDECNADCTCQGLAVVGLDCYLKNTSNPLVCVNKFVGDVDQNTQAIGLALIGCINSECKSDCATAVFQDAGADAAGDADADAN